MYLINGCNLILSVFHFARNWFNLETQIGMHKKWNIIRGVVVCLAVMFNQISLAASSIDEAIKTVADRLEAQQVKDGIGAGRWRGEAGFTGSIVAGMVGAYELTCDPNYRASAELGGDYILFVSDVGFHGDEAFALTRLSDIASDPCDNYWRTQVSDFYSNVTGSDGTKAYITDFIGAEPSAMVFYLANYVVAAYYVNAEDKQIWRQNLIEQLSRVDDSSNFPVMALGAATWALALTGPLDETLIDPSGKHSPWWDAKKLADLPSLLLSHQVPDGQPYAGSFFWQFEHGDSSSDEVVSGFTEDTIFATLGLVGAAAANPDLNLDAAILAARQALLGGIDSEGKVYEHLWLQGEIYCAYAGEMLQVLAELVVPGDPDIDGAANLTDLSIFANSRRAFNCTGCSWGNRADLDHGGEVNFVYLASMANNWLKAKSQWVQNNKHKCLTVANTTIN